MRLDLAVKKRPDARRDALSVGRIRAVDERDALRIAKIGVGLRISILVAADGGGFIPFR